MSIAPAPLAQPDDIEKGSIRSEGDLPDDVDLASIRSEDDLPDDVDLASIVTGEWVTKHFREKLAWNIKRFSYAQLQSEERLGVILLLDYKLALDELNKQYDWILYLLSGATSARDYDPQCYVKARDIYQTHLDRFPKVHKTRKAYEKFLLSIAARITTQMTDGIAPENELLRPVYELNAHRKAVPCSLSHNIGTDWQYFQSQGQDLYFQKEQTEVEKFARRSIFTLFGGFALVVPMLIMELYPTTLTACLTTTLFVIAVALLLTRYAGDKQPSDILGINAAYAAVLVIFVGSSTTGGGPDNRTVAIIMGAVCGSLILIMSLVGALMYRRFLVWRGGNSDNFLGTLLFLPKVDLASRWNPYDERRFRNPKRKTWLRVWLWPRLYAIFRS